MRVSEVMTEPVVTCQASASLNEAAQLMWEQDRGAIPVVDGDGHLAGVVTDRDICMAVYTQGKLLRDIPIQSVMATDVLACHIEDSLDTAVQLMREGQVRRVPVIDNDGRPVGIVALHDLGCLATRAKRTETNREVVETLNAVTEPRTLADGAANAQHAV